MGYFSALTQLEFQEIWRQLAGKVCEACRSEELAYISERLCGLNG